MQDLEPGQPARPMLAVASKSVEYAHTKLNGRPAIVETKFDGERMQVPLTCGCVRSPVHHLSIICEGVLCIIRQSSAKVFCARTSALQGFAGTASIKGYLVLTTSLADELLLHPVAATPGEGAGGALVLAPGFRARRQVLLRCPGRHGARSVRVLGLQVCRQACNAGN